MDNLYKQLKGLPFVSEVKRASVDNGILFVYNGRDYLLTHHTNTVLLRQPLENTNDVVDVFDTTNPASIDLYDVFWACDVWGQ